MGCEDRDVVFREASHWEGGKDPTSPVDRGAMRPRVGSRRFFCCPWCGCFESEPVIYRVQDAGGGGWGGIDGGTAWQVRVSLFSAPAPATAPCAVGVEAREGEGPKSGLEHAPSDGEALEEQNGRCSQVEKGVNGEGRPQEDSARVSSTRRRVVVEHQLTLHISAERVEAGTPVPPPVSLSPPLLYDPFEENTGARVTCFCDGRVGGISGVPAEFQSSWRRWSRCLLGCCGGGGGAQVCHEFQSLSKRRLGCLPGPKKGTDSSLPSLSKHRTEADEREQHWARGASMDATVEGAAGKGPRDDVDGEGQLCNGRERCSASSRPPPPPRASAGWAERAGDDCPSGVVVDTERVPLPEREEGSCLRRKSNVLSSAFAAKGMPRVCRSRNSVVFRQADDVTRGNADGGESRGEGSEGGQRHGDTAGSSASPESSSSSSMNASASSPCCCGLGGVGGWNSPVRRRGRSSGAVVTLGRKGGAGYFFPPENRTGSDSSPPPSPELYVHWGVCIDTPAEWRTPPEYLVSSESFLDRASHAVRTPFVKLTKPDPRVLQEISGILTEVGGRPRHASNEGECCGFPEERTSSNSVSPDGNKAVEILGETRDEGRHTDGLEKGAVAEGDYRSSSTGGKDTTKKEQLFSRACSGCECPSSSYTGDQDEDEWGDEKDSAEEQDWSTASCSFYPADNPSPQFPSPACPVCLSSSPAAPWVSDAASSSALHSSLQSASSGVSSAIYCMQLPLGKMTGPHAKTPLGIQFVLFSPPGRWIKPRDDSNFVFNIHQAVGHIQLRIASFFLRRVLLCPAPSRHVSPSSQSSLSTLTEAEAETDEKQNNNASSSPGNVSDGGVVEDHIGSARSPPPKARAGHVFHPGIPAGPFFWKEEGTGGFLRGVCRRKSFPGALSSLLHRAGPSRDSRSPSRESTSRQRTAPARTRERAVSSPHGVTSSAPSLSSWSQAAEASLVASFPPPPSSSAPPLNERQVVGTSPLPFHNECSGECRHRKARKGGGGGHR